MKLRYTLPGAGYIYRPYLLDMIQNNHTLIAGTTGSGKSVLENNIIYALLCTKYPGKTTNNSGARLVLFDPKKVELDIYKHLPHTMIYSDNIDGIILGLQRVRALIDQRLYNMKKSGLRTSNETPIYIFIDELVDLMTCKRSKEITELIKDCISISRATNTFFIMLTQAPNRKILKPEIVLNCNCRVALFCNDSIESRQIIHDETACNLPKHGLAIVQDNTDKYMIKIPLLTDDQIQRIVNHWNTQHAFFNNLFNKTMIL